jgi:hypothetical protein
MAIKGEPDLRLVTSTNEKMSLDFELSLEVTTNSLREALAILRIIDDAELLAEVPMGEAGVRHRQAVSLLAVLEREIAGAIAAQDDLLRDPRPTLVPRT